MAGSHIAIPTILKIGKGTLNNLGKYIAGAGMKNAVIYFGNGLIDMFGQQVMDSLKEENVTVVEYRELDSTNIEDIIRLAFDIDAKAQVISQAQERVLPKFKLGGALRDRRAHV